MPQDSLRSVVYRSFVTCDDPKGVAECNKTVRKSKKKESRIKKEKEEKGSKEDLQSLSCLQVMEVSRGAEKLHEVIAPFSNRPSIDTTSDLLRGALDLQESLVMLGKLQEASKFISNPIKKHGSREKRPIIVDCDYDLGSYKDVDCDDKPRVSASRDCYDELREVIRESFARQNILPKVSHQERGCDVVREQSQLCVDLPSSSSSSSLFHSRSSGCSPSRVKGSSNLIAKLMGLEEAPSRAVANTNRVVFEMEKERVPYRRGLLLDIDLPRPRKAQFMVEKRDVREKRTLEEIIETMQFKGILERKACVDGAIDCKYSSFKALSMREELAGEGPPIVIMRPLRGRDHEEPHDHHCIRNGREPMPGKKREVFPPAPQLKKSSAERASKQKLLDKGKEAKNTGNSRVRPVKKAVDSQDRVMEKSKPPLPQMQKKEAAVVKIEKTAKVTPNNTRKLAETKDAKPHSRTVRESNASKSCIARGKVAAADKSSKPKSLKPSVPKKSPRKGESNSKPTSALVQNRESDGNSAINIIVDESLAKNTEPEHTSDEVEKAYYVTDTSRNAVSSHSEDSGLITEDDSNHIEDDSCILSFVSDEIKGCKSITNTRFLLQSSVSLINHIEALFDTEARESTFFQAACLPNREVLHDTLLLDCAKEIVERKSLCCRSMRNQWSQNLSRRQKHHLSTDQLVEEISESIEGLQNYSRSCGDIVVADGIYPMLERDLRWNEEVTGGWDSGWRNGYAMEGVDQVMHHVQELLLSEIVADAIIEIML